MTPSDDAPTTGRRLTTLDAVRKTCVADDCRLPDGGDPNYDGLCAVHAWERWFKDSGNAEYWSKVECIQCELGRDCDDHPRQGDD